MELHSWVTLPMPKAASIPNSENSVPSQTPVLAEAVLDVVHGAAYPVALVVALAEVYGQGDLSELGAHSEQGGYPHPEDRAGAAEGDSAGNAGDISGADRRRKGGTHGLEGSYAALAGFLLVEDLARWWSSLCSRTTSPTVPRRSESCNTRRCLPEGSCPASPLRCR